MSVTVAQFACSACSRLFTWKPEIAGKKGKCPCGNLMIVPPAPIAKPDTPADEPDLNDIASAAQAIQAAPASEPPPSPTAGHACPSCHTPLAPNAVLCIHCGYNLKAGKKIATKIEAPATPVLAAAPANPKSPKTVLPYKTGPTEKTAIADTIEGSHFKDLYLPIALVLLGLAFEFGQIMFATGSATVGFLIAAPIVAIKVTVSLVLTFIGMLIAARLLGLALGNPWQAIIKLCAIVLAPSALGGIIAHLMGNDLTGWWVGTGVSILLYWTLLVVLFDLDWSEMQICVAIIWVLNWFATMLVALITASWLGGI